jgi:hypothetical protein
MKSQSLLTVAPIAVAISLALLFIRAEGTPAAKSAVQFDRVVAGGSKDFLEVRHVRLQGTNEAIGHALANIARERYQLKPAASSDGLRTRVQRRYVQERFPILFARMRGAAAAFGRPLEDDAQNFTGLWYYEGLKAGCSVVYFPPALTATQTGIVSRNYDFTTGTLFGMRPPPGELGCTARPYLIEMHPDRGYPSLALCAYDLLSGVLDGINSEGLTVALLADDELMAKFKMEPAGDSAVGLGILQMQRLLLDTCANVDEAKEALLLTKQYYEVVPVHYLIADRHGRSFVWEYSHAHNREYIVENPGKPLITTNFSLHRFLEDEKNPPSAAKAKAVCPRYCKLAERLASTDEKLTPEMIKETHKTVDLVQPVPAGSPRAAHRTLWHALYFPEQRKVQVSFYLRDEPNAEQPDKVRIVRSEYLEFKLEGK